VAALLFGGMAWKPEGPMSTIDSKYDICIPHKFKPGRSMDAAALILTGHQVRAYEVFLFSLVRLQQTFLTMLIHIGKAPKATEHVKYKGCSVRWYLAVSPCRKDGKPDCKVENQRSNASHVRFLWFVGWVFATSLTFQSLSDLMTNA
jgi:hypothetical protein